MAHCDQIDVISVVFDESSVGMIMLNNLAKVGRRVGMLGHIPCNVTAFSSSIIYTFFFRPIIEYCDTVWGCCGQGICNGEAICPGRRGRPETAIQNQYSAASPIDPI